MKVRFQRGFSLVDVIVGTALLLIIFMALFGMFRASIALTAASKARAGATSLANEQMEFIRSLTYANTGTVGGIPAGVIPQEQERILNGRTYTIRTFVQYVDDPADGLDAQDETGVITDYKKIKVAVSYEINARTQNVSLVSNRTPRGIESVEGGGTLRINVIDSLGSPISSAQVRIQNASADPAVDLTAFTGNGGYVFLPGAQAATGYEVSVSKNEYSSTQTYDQSAQNVNPNPGHLTVAEAQTTQGTFVIDILSNLLIYTWEKIRGNFFEDMVSDSANFSTQTNTQVAGGMLSLTETEGVYDTNGSARSVEITPAYISEWEFFQATSTRPSGTTILYKFLYDNAGVPTYIPDGDLPGNSSGFSSSIVDLSSVATSTYSSLFVEGVLQTNNTSVTPSIDAWRVAYTEGPIPIPSVPFTLTGTKTIGEDGSGSPIIKNTLSHTTDGDGRYTVTDVEWDAYDLSVSGYDIATICNPDDLLVNPSTVNLINVFLEPATNHSLRITVRTDSEQFIENATVALTRTGFSQEEETGSCGQAYFGGLSSLSDYAVEVSAPGFVAETINDVDISGETELNVVLSTS